MVIALSPLCRVSDSGSNTGADLGTGVPVSLIKQTRLDASVLGRHLMTAVQRATTTPDEERRKDVWDLAVLGLSRRLDFTPVPEESVNAHCLNDLDCARPRLPDVEPPGDLGLEDVELENRILRHRLDLASYTWE